MSEAPVDSPVAEPAHESDAALVARCARGDERAWEQLVHRYKRLIYSIPLKYGATTDAAADIFQAVCVDLVTDLPRLRRPEALKGWLIRVTQHKALKWKGQARRQVEWSTADAVTSVADDRPCAPDILAEVQREQAVRAAVAALPARCRELVTLLFFTTPPPPYVDVARRLGLATGSIGFIRQRCLRKLEASLRLQGL